MSGLLIAAPLRLEALAISRGQPPARVLQTGMGPRRARAAVPGLLRDPGEALLVLGFGGGLLDGSEVGDVVVADEVRGPRGVRVACTDAPALARVLEDHGPREGHGPRVEDRGLRVRRGVVASVTRPALGETRVRLRESGAIAVDMESVWLAAGARGRPFAVVRVLSDTPTRELTRPLSTVAGLARASAVLRRVAAALHGWTPELHEWTPGLHEWTPGLHDWTAGE